MPFSSLTAGCPCCSGVPLVFRGSGVAERKVKPLWKFTFGLGELHLSISIIVLSAEVFENIFQNSFWILCINHVLMCHCRKSMKGFWGKKKTNKNNKKIEIVQIYRIEHSNMGKSVGICSYTIFCRIRKWSKQLQMVSVHKLFQSWKSCNPNLCCLYGNNMAIIITLRL